MVAFPRPRAVIVFCNLIHCFSTFSLTFPSSRCLSSQISFIIRDGPVDLVGGRGGGEGVVEFAKINLQSPNRALKKIEYATLEKKLQSKTSNVVIAQSILFE